MPLENAEMGLAKRNPPLIANRQEKRKLRRRESRDVLRGSIGELAIKKFSG
jgi:hypothetical protein